MQLSKIATLLLAVFITAGSLDAFAAPKETNKSTIKTTKSVQKTVETKKAKNEKPATTKVVAETKSSKATTKPTTKTEKTAENKKVKSEKATVTKAVAEKKSSKATSKPSTKTEKTAENKKAKSEKSAATKAVAEKKSAKTTNKKTAAPTSKKVADDKNKKSVTAKKENKKSEKKVTKKAQNETKQLYGVKGIKLAPTKVSNRIYSYREKGKTYKSIGKESSRSYSQTGVASYYGGMFHGRKTANGEIFNKNAYTAAHKTLALGSYALVTNLRNGRKVIVKINDRGPFSKNRIIDLSVASAKEIGMIHSGVARVKVEAMQVDSQGYISGSAAHSLYRLAKREGLPLKVKGEGKNFAIKAE